MRTLSSTSRALLAAAAIVAAGLVLGGAYFVGYIGEIQRDLSDPASLRRQAGAEIATVEKSLGYAGFLKAYRNYRLTGDSKARPHLGRTVAEAAAALTRLRKHYTGNKSAAAPLGEAAAVLETFAHIARIAPQLGDAALRGTAAMDTLNTLPQSPQLEATYLSLLSALERLRDAEREQQLGGAASALSWSQFLIIAAVAALVVGLLVAAGLLQLGIIQPLKSLERSLTSVGDGAVGQKIWGADRADEFGALARAGERVRRGLAETDALKALADKGRLHLTLEGQASVLFEKLAADVTSAPMALKTASADLGRMQEDSRRQFEATIHKLGQSGTAFADAAKAAREHAVTAICEIRGSAANLDEAAASRLNHLDEIARRFDQSSHALEQTAKAAAEKATAATGELSSSNASLKRIAGDAQLIQNAFFTACDKISSDAANTTDKVQTLASRLAEAVGSVDERLGQKLTTLDRLEQGLSETLAKLQQRANDTVAALNDATGALGERSAAAEARMSKTAAEFEEVIRLFRDDEAALHQSSAQTILEMRAAQRTVGDTAETQAQLFAAIARLDEIAAAVQQRPAPSAPSLDLTAVMAALHDQSESIRGEIRDLAVRMTEDRLLAGADMPLLGAKSEAPAQGQSSRTLAEIPDSEILSRLKNLASEMNTAQTRFDQVASLKHALSTFASEVKTLAANADRAARLKTMGKALDRHADEIEARAEAIEPTESVRSELHAITSELRTIAARAQSTGVKEGPALREAAIQLGARAESLFGHFDRMPEASGENDGEPASDDTMDAAAADLAALAQLIARLEARAEHLTQTALAKRFGEVSDTMSPAERHANGHGELETDGAIHTVFESIERLNNIAAALARAGDADRQRRATH